VRHGRSGDPEEGEEGEAAQRRKTGERRAAMEARARRIATTTTEGREKESRSATSLAYQGEDVGIALGAAETALLEAQKKKRSYPMLPSHLPSQRVHDKRRHITIKAFGKAGLAI